MITGLRLSLAVIFIWFGGLKIAGYDPVYDIINSSFPFMAEGPGYLLLGIGEVAIGIGLLLNIFYLFVHSALIFHLIGTFSTFVFAPDLMFDPKFPILTLAGEFVFKNATLAMAGLVVMAHERRKRA
jgi:putative oxidoreductase